MLSILSGVCHFPQGARNLIVPLCHYLFPAMIFFAVIGCSSQQYRLAERTIEELAAWLRKVKLKGPIIYAVPQHKLSAEIEKKFAEQGINARRFLGRGQVDPKHENPDLPKNAPFLEPFS